MLLIHYPPCSTCKKAKQWLDDHGLSYTTRHIKEENPTFFEGGMHVLESFSQFIFGNIVDAVIDSSNKIKARREFLLGYIPKQIGAPYALFQGLFLRVIEHF